MTKTTILTIDDDAGLRELAQDVFEQAGYRAIVVPDVAVALRVLGGIGVDLVLLGYETKPGAGQVVRPGRTPAGRSPAADPAVDDATESGGARPGDGRRWRD